MTAVTPERGDGLRLSGNPFGTGLSEPRLVREVAAPSPATDEVVEVLRPFAELGVPKRHDGKSGFYYIRFADIEDARSLLAKLEVRG